MAFWEGVFGNLAKPSTRITDRYLEEIAELKMQLVDLGYNPLEVDYMVTSHAKGDELDRLGSDQLETIVEALRGQLFIARQCVQAVRKS